VLRERKPLKLSKKWENNSTEPHRLVYLWNYGKIQTMQ
jgi:hypothetical protein